MLFGTSVFAHQMSPTYPELKASYMDGLSTARVRVFNKREDVKFYEIGVFDKDMKPIPFVTQYHLRGINFNQYAIFDVFINDKYRDDAVYVCTESMLTEGKLALASKICSKFKK